MSENEMRELLDKQAIRDVLSRYGRGLDRMDMSIAAPLQRAEISAGSTRDERDLSFEFIPKA